MRCNAASSRAFKSEKTSMSGKGKSKVLAFRLLSSLFSGDTANSKYILRRLLQFTYHCITKCSQIHFGTFGTFKKYGFLEYPCHIITSKYECKIHCMYLKYTLLWAQKCTGTNMSECKVRCRILLPTYVFNTLVGNSIHRNSMDNA